LPGGPTPRQTSLVKDAYAKLGYIWQDDAARANESRSSATVSLQAVGSDGILGTLSVNLDSNQGLQAEQLYPQEVEEIRSHGSSCEFTRLALDTKLVGREVLCSLFYMAYVFSHWAHEAKNLLIEVNPRHQTFYERMLGFQRVGEERICKRVSAPAVLLHLDFEFTKEQIHRARQGLSVAGTTLYRYAAPVSEEEHLIRQMGSAVP
jgi:hypothetical protein